MRLLLIAVVLGACGSSATAPAAPARTAAPFPDDTTSIAQGPRGGFVLAYLRSLADGGKTPLPPCFDRITNRIEAQYQLELGGGAAQVQVFDGPFDRDEVEACVADFDRAIAAIMGEDVVHFRAERRGELTTITQEDPKKTRVGWIAWSPHRVVVAGDEATARRVLANPHPLAADALLQRLWVETEGGDLRLASVRDMTSRFLGVPSTGFTLRAREAETKATKSIFARVQFATDRDAEAALAALAAAPRRAGTPPEVGRFIELLHGRREGHELVVDVGALMTAPDGLATMQALVGAP